MHHPSHYKERTFFSLFIALFGLSIVLLLSDIDSFTGLLSMFSAQVAESCDKTIPPSLACADGVGGNCADGFSKHLVLDKKGDVMCCCTPPPEISISVKEPPAGAGGVT